MSPLLISYLVFQSPLPTHRVTGDYQNAEVREVIKALMRTAPKLPYTIDSEITGPINLKIDNIPFPDALKRLARAAYFTYSLEDGGIFFRYIPDPTPKSTPIKKGITWGSGREVLFERLRAAEANTNSILTKEVKNLRATTEPAWKVIKRALDSVGANYIISDSLKSPITLNIKKAPLHQVLTAIMPLCNGSYSETANIITVAPLFR